MITSECPKCEQSIEFDEHGVGETVQCPACGNWILLRSGFGANRASVSKSQTWQQNPLAKMMAGLGAVFGLLMLFAAFGVLKEGTDGYNKSQAEGMQFDAWHTAKGFLQAKLPAAREISDYDQSAVQIEGDKYLVGMVVDGSQYAVQIHSAGGRWLLDNIILMPPAK